MRELYCRGKSNRINCKDIINYINKKEFTIIYLSLLRIFILRWIRKYKQVEELRSALSSHQAECYHAD